MKLTSTLTTKIAVGAAVVAAAAAVPIWAASAATGAGTKPLCRTSDVSYYYGGVFAGLGQRSFDITLVAHDGTDCRLSDQPLLKLTGSGDSQPNVPVTIGGRGGTLRITPAAPLHTTISWHTPDTSSNKLSVQSLTLRMPGGGIANAEPFLYPGPQDVAKSVPIIATAWQTGLGGGQESGA